MYNAGVKEIGFNQRKIKKFEIITFYVVVGIAYIFLIVQASSFGNVFDDKEFLTKFLYISKICPQFFQLCQKSIIDALDLNCVVF